MKYIKWWVLFLILLPMLFWYFATPRVRLHYPETADGRLHVFIITPYEKYSADIFPGETVGGIGRIFPDNDYFMQFDWNVSGGHRCINVKPKWPVVDIYLGADREIDRSLVSGTDNDQLFHCATYD
jgi:hypothetical protein